MSELNRLKSKLLESRQEVNLGKQRKEGRRMSSPKLPLPKGSDLSILG